MNNKFVALEDIQAFLNHERVIPSILMWNRLEGRPHTKDFDRALKAEIRDALFMLAKQWAMGEFRGDDAGSPVLAKVHMETTRLTKFTADNHPSQLFEDDICLEAKVEQRRLPFKAGGQDLSLDLRLIMGRQWLKMISGQFGHLKRGFIDAFPVVRPDASKYEDAQICAHLTTWQHYAAVAEKAMDGASLFFYLLGDVANHAYDKLPVETRNALTESEREIIQAIETTFVKWFRKLCCQPESENADSWLPSRLEYQFSCSAPKKNLEEKFTAKEYYHGHLDWYNLNVSETARESADGTAGDNETAEPEKAHTYSFIPTQIQFDGMPNTRWWSFEEGKTNFGDIKPDTTDLNKLLVMEFGLVYANDWFLLPLTLPAGSVANIRGLAVTNVFGERTWVRSASEGAEDWESWSVFTLNVENAPSGNPNRTLLLLPTVPKIQESDPIEEVYLIRDEMANMVWGIETRVLLPDGLSKSGREAALELHTFYQRMIEKEGIADSDAATETDAGIRYQLMSAVPENWIPFIPVHVKDSNRKIQLQRGTMKRILKGDRRQPEKIRPRTLLLREGLDKDPKRAYMVFEEEVPRAGIRVCQTYQRTRWYGGKVITWLGVRKQTGRGESASGLAFDQVLPVEKK